VQFNSDKLFSHSPLICDLHNGDVAHQNSSSLLSVAVYLSSKLFPFRSLVFCFTDH